MKKVLFREVLTACAHVPGRIYRTAQGAVVILGCYFAGKFISGLLSHFLSGSVIGMLLLFALLAGGIVKKEQVAPAAGFLLDNLILFFIPALVGVALIDPSRVYSSLADIVIIGIVSTALVMAATGVFVEWRLKRATCRKRRKSIVRNTGHFYIRMRSGSENIFSSGKDSPVKKEDGEWK